MLDHRSGNAELLPYPAMLPLTASPLSLIVPPSSFRAGSGDVWRLLLTAKPTLLALLYPCMKVLLGAGRVEAKGREARRGPAAGTAKWPPLSSRQRKTA